MRKLFFILGLFLLIFKADFAFAIERIGVISDSIMSEQTPYNAYSRTPDFLVQDIIDELNKNRNLQVVSASQAREAILKSNLPPKEFARLQDIQNGYSLDFVFLKKVAKAIGVSKMVIVTSGIDTQRDFLKSTLWNSIGVPGFDTVNPTQKVSVYAVFVDVNRETVLWEDLFAKNIRNNKMRNLDTTVAGNYEGLMRLKQYSKYISPEISNSVIARVAPGSLKPTEYGSKLEYVVMGVNHKMRIGSQKNLSNIDYISDGFDVFDEKVAETKENINNKKEEMKSKWAQKKEEMKAMQAKKQEEVRLKKEYEMSQKVLDVNYVEPANIRQNMTPAELKLKDRKHSSEPTWFMY